MTYFLTLDVDLSRSGWAEDQVVKLPENKGLLALAPANDLTALIGRTLEKQGRPFQIFDRDPSKPFIYPLGNYSDLLKDREEVVGLWVGSPNYEKAIADHLINLGFPAQKLAHLDPPPERARVFSLDEALTWARALPRDERVEQRVERLAQLVGEKPYLVVKGPYWYDLVEKARLLRDALGFEVIWVSGVTEPVREEQTRFIQAGWRDVLVLAQTREQGRQACFLLVHGLTFTDAVFLRAFCPPAKIVSYVYDWLPHSVPYQERHRLSLPGNQAAAVIDSEYAAAQAILNAGVVDGLLFKDGGADFSLYQNIEVANLFFPTCLPEARYQPPPEAPEPGTPGRMLFVGTLFGSESDPEVSGHSIFFDTFAAIAGQGIPLHVYYLPVRNAPSVVNEYRQHLAHQPLVEMIPGQPLDALLPQLAGRFHWGAMIAAADFGFARTHAAHTLPSRIFTYAALGIPIVVSNEFEDLCDLVRRYGIGVVIRRDQIHQLGQILRQQDYSSLQQAVLAFRSEFSLERRAPALVDFFARTTNKAEVLS